MSTDYDPRMTRPYTTGMPVQGHPAQPQMAQTMQPGAYAQAYPQSYPYAGYAQPGIPAQAPAASYPQQSTSLLNLSNDRFVKGLLIGAAATYILTNESVQRTAIKGAVQVWSMLQGGLEEMKERFHDAEAELHAADAAKPSESD